jgi:hypothetical protein
MKHVRLAERFFHYDAKPSRYFKSKVISPKRIMDLPLKRRIPDGIQMVETELEDEEGVGPAMAQAASSPRPRTSSPVGAAEPLSKEAGKADGSQKKSSARSCVSDASIAARLGPLPSVEEATALLASESITFHLSIALRASDDCEEASPSSAQTSGGDEVIEYDVELSTSQRISMLQTYPEMRRLFVDSMNNAIHHERRDRIVAERRFWRYALYSKQVAELGFEERLLDAGKYEKLRESGFHWDEWLNERRRRLANDKRSADDDEQDDEPHIAPDHDEANEEAEDEISRSVVVVVNPNNNNLDNHLRAVLDKVLGKEPAAAAVAADHVGLAARPYHQGAYINWSTEEGFFSQLLPSVFVDGHGDLTCRTRMVTQVRRNLSHSRRATHGRRAWIACRASNGPMPFSCAGHAS